MIAVTGVESRVHATIFRGAGGKFLYLPHCVLCTKQFGVARAFGGGLCFGAAFICDPCVEQHANDNLSLAVAGTWHAAPGQAVPVTETTPAKSIRVKVREKRSRS